MFVDKSIIHMQSADEPFIDATMTEDDEKTTSLIEPTCTGSIQLGKTRN